MEGTAPLVQQTYYIIIVPLSLFRLLLLLLSVYLAGGGMGPAE